MEKGSERCRLHEPGWLTERRSIAVAGHQIREITDHDSTLYPVRTVMRPSAGHNGNWTGENVVRFPWATRMTNECKSGARPQHRVTR